jgi:hypothetical protein
MFPKRRWLKLLLLVVLAVAGFSYAMAEIFYNLNSNLVFIAVRRAESIPLKIRLKRGAWKVPTDVTPADLASALIERHSEPGLRWSTLHVRREAGPSRRNVSTS